MVTTLINLQSFHFMSLWGSATDCKHNNAELVTHPVDMEQHKLLNEVII